jgi:hypothetical protein
MAGLLSDKRVTEVAVENPRAEGGVGKGWLQDAL